jgi:hypothetical protein
VGGARWSRRRLGPEDVFLAAAALAFNGTCEVLDVSFNHVGASGAVALCRLLRVRARLGGIHSLWRPVHVG